MKLEHCVNILVYNFHNSILKNFKYVFNCVEKSMKSWYSKIGDVSASDTNTSRIFVNTCLGSIEILYLLLKNILSNIYQIHQWHSRIHIYDVCEKLVEIYTNDGSKREKIQ